MGPLSAMLRELHSRQLKYTENAVDYTIGIQRGYVAAEWLRPKICFMHKSSTAATKAINGRSPVTRLQKLRHIYIEQE